MSRSPVKSLAERQREMRERMWIIKVLGGRKAYQKQLRKWGREESGKRR